MTEFQSLLQWQYLYGPPKTEGRLRATAADFFVDEALGFAPDGEGQHRLIHIEKRNTNTEWLARQIAKLAGVATKEVGFAGLKDRNAVTRQWFSVDLAGRDEPDWTSLESDEISILEVTPHGRKLRRGTLQGNHFRIRITDILGSQDDVDARLQQISNDGVPNYFTEQRFGHDYDNLQQALAMFGGRRVKDRHRRSLYLSAARSLIFNLMLSQRIQQGLWEEILHGDVMMLDGSHSVFVVEQVDSKLSQRLATHDIHHTAPMWGRGQLMSQAEARSFEQSVIDELQLQDWCRGLEQAGLKQERRSLRVVPQGFQWQWQEGTLQLSFFLPPGSYATAVIRELFQAR